MEFGKYILNTSTKYIINDNRNWQELFDTLCFFILIQNITSLKKHFRIKLLYINSIKLCVRCKIGQNKVISLDTSAKCLKKKT